MEARPILVSLLQPVLGSAGGHHIPSPFAGVRVTTSFEALLVGLELSHAGVTGLGLLRSGWGRSTVVSAEQAVADGMTRDASCCSSRHRSEETRTCRRCWSPHDDGGVLSRRRS
jgi:hypothetical protein